MYVVATVSLSCANHPHVAPSEGLSQLMGASPSFSGGNVVGRLHSCCFSVFVDLWLSLIGIWKWKGFFVKFFRVSVKLACGVVNCEVSSGITFHLGDEQWCTSPEVFLHLRKWFVEFLLSCWILLCLSSCRSFQMSTYKRQMHRFSVRRAIWSCNFSLGLAVNPRGTHLMLILCANSRIPKGRFSFRRPEHRCPFDACIYCRCKAASGL